MSAKVLFTFLALPFLAFAASPVDPCVKEGQPVRGRNQVSALLFDYSYIVFGDVAPDVTRSVGSRLIDIRVQDLPLFQADIDGDFHGIPNAFGRSLIDLNFSFKRLGWVYAPGKSFRDFQSLMRTAREDRFITIREVACQVANLFDFGP